MNEQEILEFNRKCAEFMGAKPQQFGASKEYELYGVIESIEDGEDEKHFFATEKMKFHSDWNWIMGVVEKINDHNNIFSINENQVIVANNERSEIIVNIIRGTMKEATIDAINKFLNWHNTNKAKATA